LEVSVLDTVVDLTKDVSSLRGHLTVLRVASHSRSNTTSDLSGGFHDHAETFLEVSPEIKVLEVLGLLVELLELSALDTIVDSIEDISSLRSHLTVLRVASHGRSNTTSNLSSGFHDHAKTSLEVIPEAELLELKPFAGDHADTLVESTEDASSGGDLGLTGDLANSAEDGSSRLHNHTETLFEALGEAAPEVELLESHLSRTLDIGDFSELLESMNLTHLVADISHLAPAILGVEVVVGIRCGFPVLLVVII
jgi:hypothetical protein